MVPLFLSLLTPSASAQIMLMVGTIAQGEREVGQIFVPEHEEACKYVEYWFLYEDFTFLGPRDRGEFTVRSEGAPGSYEAWERAMFEAHPKGKLLTSVSVETREGCK